MTRANRTHLRLLVVLASFGLLAASCGGSSEDASDGVATLEDQASEPIGDAAAAETLEDAEPELSAEEVALEFTQCLRDEGAEVADVGVDAEGRIQLRDAFQSVDRQDESFQAAMDVCQPLLESVGFGQAGRAAIGENVEIADALVEFSQCIRDAGYDVGDLELGGAPGQGGQPPADADGDGAARGEAQRQGGFGDRSARFADQLGLDIEDPDVAATMDVCTPIIDAAFSAAGIGQPPQG